MRGRVLVVEDDSLVARVMARLIRSHGEVTLAHGVGEALAVVMGPDLIDAAVVDLGLPDGCGLEVLKHIRASRAHVPILVLTGDERVRGMEEAQALGAMYALKPVEPRKLVAFFQTVAVNRYLAAVDHAAAGLSCRQRQIVWQSAFGAGADLCAELNISSSTMRTHRLRIRDALGQPMEMLLGRLRRCYLHDDGGS
jgi:DNA-binding response OmpR family regulator